MSETSDHYATLGVSPRASRTEIDIALNRQVKRFAKADRDPAKNSAFRRLVMAYHVLSDPDRRAAYDQAQSTRVMQDREPIQVKMLASQNTLPALKEDQILYVLLDISANPALVETETPLSLCMVVDRSTSMEGSRIGQVKAAASLIADKMRPGDALSLVTFSDYAEVIVPLTMTDNRTLIKSRISQISTGGATEILRGLKAGMAELRRAQRLSGICHLVLLTDGHTYGDEDACIELAKQGTAEGIGISAIGIGHEWHDAFLDALVVPSGGSSAYLASPDKATEYLDERVRALSRTFAQDIQLSVETSPRLTMRSVHRLSPFPHPIPKSGRALPLGSLQHNAPLLTLMELGVQPHAPAATTNIRAALSASIVPTGQRNMRFSADLVLDFSASPPNRPPLPAVLRAVNKLNLYLINEKAYEAAEQGAVEQASQRMTSLGRRLLDEGEVDLAHTAFTEASQITRTGRQSPEGRKALKYGTRSLIGGHDRLS